MRVYSFCIPILACLFALESNAVETAKSLLTAKLTSVDNPALKDTTEDLTVSASDRTFHLGKEYGQPGLYATGDPYGSYLGFGNSIYGPGSGYRITGGSPGYRGYTVSGPNGILGGGHLGYGYYGNSGYNPGYGGYGYGNYGGYNGYVNGLGGYSGYGNINDDGYYGGRYGGYGRYGTDGYRYGQGYGGYAGSNYGNSYNAKSNYDPYIYRGNSYGSYGGYPSGYRGYS